MNAILTRMSEAPELVRARLRRASGILNEAEIPYAVVGGNAVALWVATIDEDAVRNTRDVDLLVERCDWPKVVAAMQASGLIFRHAASLDMFLEHPDDKARRGIHIIFGGERVNERQILPNPATTESVDMDGIRVIALAALVRLKLDAWRDKDRTHLRDFLEVGLINATWLTNLPEPLAERLRHLIEHPE